MPDEIPGNESLLRAQWSEGRAEADRTVARYIALERLALVATALIWVALAATTSVDWDPLIKWLPFVLNVPIALRAVAFAWRLRSLERHLAAVERHLAVPPELALEGTRGARRVGLLTVFGFWMLLLAATALLPFFYIERATEPDYQNDTSTTYRPRAHAGSTLAAALPPAR